MELYLITANIPSFLQVGSLLFFSPRYFEEVFFEQENQLTVEKNGNKSVRRLQEVQFGGMEVAKTTYF